MGFNEQTKFYSKAIELCNNTSKFFIFTPLNFYNKVFHLSLSLRVLSTSIPHFACLLYQLFGPHCMAHHKIYFKEWLPSGLIPGSPCAIKEELRVTGPTLRVHLCGEQLHRPGKCSSLLHHFYLYKICTEALLLTCEL